MANTKLLFEVFTNDSIEEKYQFADFIAGFCSERLGFSEYTLVVRNLSREPEIALLRNIVVLPALDVTENQRTTRVIGSFENMNQVILACAQRQACLKMTEDAQKMVESTQRMLEQQH